MQKDEINVSNKIIKVEDLLDIFNKMNEDLEKYRKTYKNEEQVNNTLEFKYQKWTFKDEASSLKFEIGYNDGTEIQYEEYANFITTFNNRIEDIKRVYVHYNLYYRTTIEDGKTEYHHQNITMFIYTNKIEISISIDKTDNKMKELYDLIKNKIDNSPIKYDEIITNKPKITLTIGTVIGFIIATAICVILLIFPTIRTLYSQSFVLYPIFCLFLTFVFGGVIGTNLVDDYYKNLLPEKKYDSSSKKYKDDIDDYTTKSEVLFGKNFHNLENRKKIKETYEEYKKYIRYEVIALIVISIIVIIIGM